MKESEEKKNISSRKSWSIFGFLISILLLIIAIVLSMNEEKATREAKVNINSSIEQASSEMSKTINEVQSSSKIQNEVNALNEIEDNSLREGNSNEISNNNTLNEIDSLDKKNSNVVQYNENATTTQSNEGNTQSNQDGDNTQSNQNEENVKSNSNGENEQLNQNKENQDNENASNEQFIMPVEGEISAVYSIDNLQYSNTLQEWITHRGIDIKADKTTVVKASKSGTIKYIKEDPRYGLSITIEHSDGFQTVYSSLLSTEFVKEGDKVEQGQSIGTVGNSAVFESAEGSHLHFEILKDGEYVNPDIYLK